MEKGNYKIEFIVDTDKAEKSVKGFDSELEEFAGKDGKRSKALEAKKQSDRAKSVKDQKKANKSLTSALEQEHQKRMKGFKGNLKKQVSEHERHLKLMLSAEKDNAKKIAALRTQTAGGRAAGKMKSGFDTGGIVGAAKALPGVAKVAAVAGAAIVGLGKAWIDAGIKADQFNNTIERLGNTAKISGEELKVLQADLLSIRRPADMSADAVAKLATTVATFEKPENIAATVETIMDLQRIEPGASMDKIVGSVGRLGKAIGDNQLAMDLIAQQAQALKGKVADPLDEALTELSVVYSKASTVYQDQEKAMRDSAGLLSALVETGVEVSEATTQAEELMLKLNDIANDPKIREGIFDKIPEGFDKLKSGLENGSVGAIDFIKELEKMGPAGNEVAYAIGSTAGEGVQALLKSFEVGGKTIGDFTAQFDNVTGAAGRMADEMVSPIVKAQEQMGTSWDNIMLSVGQSSEGFVSNGLGAIADMMMGAESWFESPVAGFARIKDEMSGFNETADQAAMMADMVGTEIAGMGEGGEQNALPLMQGMVDRLNEMDGVSIIVKDQMAALMTSEAPIVERLTEMQGLLQGVEGIATNQTLALSIQAAVLAAETLNNKLATQMGFWESLGRGIAEYSGIGQVFVDGVGEEISDIFSDTPGQIKAAQAELDALNAKAKGLATNTEEWRDAIAEAGIKRDEIIKLTGQQEQIEAGLAESVEKQLSVIVKSGDALTDKESAYQSIIRAMDSENSELADNEDYQKRIRELIDNQYDGQVDIAKAQKNTNKLSMIQETNSEAVLDNARQANDESMDFNKQNIRAYKVALATEGKLTEEQRESLNVKVAALEKEYDTLDAMDEAITLKENEIALQELELDLKDGYIDILGEEFDWNAATNAQKINALELQKAEIDGEITKIETIISGLQSQVLMQNGRNELELEAANLAAKYNAELSKSGNFVELQREDSSVRVEQMQGLLADLKSKSAALGTKIGTLSTAGVKPTAKGRGGARAGRGADRSEQKSDKADKAEQKASQQAQKEAVDRQKALDKEKEEAEKKRIEHIKKITDIYATLDDERAKINREWTESQKGFMDDRKQAHTDYIDGLKEISANLSSEIEQFTKDTTKELHDLIKEPIETGIGMFLDAMETGSKMAIDKQEMTYDDIQQRKKEKEKELANIGIEEEKKRQELIEQERRRGQEAGLAHIEQMMLQGGGAILQKQTQIKEPTRDITVMSAILRAVMDETGREDFTKEELAELLNGQTEVTENIIKKIEDSLGKSADQIMVTQNEMIFKLREGTNEFGADLGGGFKLASIVDYVKDSGNAFQILTDDMQDLGIAVGSSTLANIEQGKHFENISDLLSLTSNVVDRANETIEVLGKNAGIAGTSASAAASGAKSTIGLAQANIESSIFSAYAKIQKARAELQATEMEKEQRARIQNELDVFEFILQNQQSSIELAGNMRDIYSEMRVNFDQAMQTDNPEEYAKSIEKVLEAYRELGEGGIQDTLKGIDAEIDEQKIKLQELRESGMDYDQTIIDAAVTSLNNLEKSREAFQIVADNIKIIEDESLQQTAQKYKDNILAIGLFAELLDDISKTEKEYEDTVAGINEQNRDRLALMIETWKANEDLLDSEIDDEYRQQLIAENEQLRERINNVDELNSKELKALADRKMGKAKGDIEAKADGGIVGSADEMMKIGDGINEASGALKIYQKELDKATDPEQIKELEKNISEAENTVGEGVGAAIQAVGTAISNTVDMVLASIETIDGIIESAGSGDVGAVVSGGADLAIQVGQALMKSKGKLATAGAVILGVGMLGKAVGKILSLIIKPEKSAADLAGERADEQERIMNAYKIQVETIDDLQKLESKLTDTAKERLDIMMKEYAVLQGNSKLFDDMKNASDDTLVNMKKSSKIEMDGLTNTLTDAQDILEGGTRGDMGDFLEKMGMSTSGSNKQRLKEFVDDLEASLIDAETKFDSVEAEITFRSNIEALKDQIYQELKSIQDLKIKIALELDFEDDLAAEAFIARTESVMKALSDARISGLEGEKKVGTLDLSNDFIENIKIINTWIGTVDIESLTGDTRALVDEFISLAGSAGNFAEQVFSDDKAMLGFQKSIDKLGKTKEEQDIIEDKYRRDQLDLMEEQLDFLIQIGGSELEIMALRAGIADLRQQELDMQNEQNELTEAELAKIRELHQLRQQMILAGGADPAAVAAIESQIIAKMRDAGASEEAIEDTIDSFQAASYAVGSPYIPEDQLALVHQGERIFTASENMAMIDAVNRLSSMPSIDDLVAPVVGRYMNSMSDLGAAGNGGGSVSYSIGDVIVNVPEGTNDSEGIAQAVIDSLAEYHDEMHEANGTANGR